MRTATPRITGGLSSSCETIILRNKSYDEIVHFQVYYVIRELRLQTPFPNARSKKRKIQAQNDRETLRHYAAVCFKHFHFANVGNQLGNPASFLNRASPETTSSLGTKKLSQSHGCHVTVWSPARLSLRIVFLTIESANKVEINILSARGTTSPGPWARASLVMMQWFRWGGGVYHVMSIQASEPTVHLWLMPNLLSLKTYFV